MRNVREDDHRYYNQEDPEYDTFDSLNIGGREYPELRYADDTVLLSTSSEALEKKCLYTSKHIVKIRIFS